MEERWNEPTDGEREGEYGSQGGRAGGAQKIGNIRDDGIVPPFSRCVLAPSSFGMRGHRTVIYRATRQDVAQEMEGK